MSSSFTPQVRTPGAGDQALIERVLSNPLLFPTVFKQWLITYLGTEVQVTQSQVVNATTAIYIGTGTPQGMQAAAVGSVYLRLDGGAGTSIYFKEVGDDENGWSARDVFTNGLTITDAKDVAIGGGTGSKIGQSTSKLGFFGVTPVAKRSAYTQTYATADKTLGAYTPNSQASAYSSTPADLAHAATLVDLNALRVAYENLRAFVEDGIQMSNAVVDDLQALGLVG